MADKGSTAATYGYSPLIVRKDLVDSGKVKIFADLKGLKIAAAGPWSTTNAKPSVALVKGGLTYKDVDSVNISYPQQIAVPLYGDDLLTKRRDVGSGS